MVPRTIQWKLPLYRMFRTGFSSGFHCEPRWKTSSEKTVTWRTINIRIDAFLLKQNSIWHDLKCNIPN